MKFLFTARNPSLFVQYEQVIKGLVDKGHSVEFHLVSMQWRNAQMDTLMLQEYSQKTDGAFCFVEAKKTKGIRASLLRHKREIVNYAAYLREENPVSRSPYMADRQRQSLFPPMDHLLLNRFVVKYILKKNRVKKLDFIEKFISADNEIVSLLEGINPDLVIASPFIFSRSTIETEYIKAANKIGIPTCAAIFSWDNLTSKGVFQVIPSAITVWNEMQVKELEEIHSVPPAKVITTGAPSLDVWFDKTSQYSFGEFCTTYEIPKKNYVLYLCSSQTIAKDENSFVAELVKFMRKELGNNCPTVVIRPHPLNIDIWSDWDVEGTVIVPKSSRDIFYSTEAKDLMFESIFHSCCVIGLNTTAMIETAIVGKPCFTVIVDNYKNTQEMSGHFHHLEESGFMYSCKSLVELTEKISTAIIGEDLYQSARGHFIDKFVRPCGENIKSSVVMQTVLEKLASGSSIVEVKKSIENMKAGCRRCAE